MKTILLSLFVAVLALPALAGTGELNTEVDSLLLEVDEEEKVGQSLKVELRYLSPAWRVRRQGNGLRLVGMSKDVVRAMGELNRNREYRCRASGTYNPKGIRLERLDRCRSIWKN